MDGIQRTVPRSARRTVPRRDLPSFTPVYTLPDTPERYAPSFGAAFNATPKPEPKPLPQIRTGIEALSADNAQPTYAYASAPLTAVRWLPVSGRVAVAAVGSGDGGVGMDFVRLYAVEAGQDGVAAALGRELPHGGKVLRLAVSQTERMLYVGSSDGSVRMLRAESWEDTDEGLSDVCPSTKQESKREAVTGLAPLAGGLVAALGGHGGLTLVDVGAEREVLNVPLCDAVGFTDAAAVDADSGYEVLSAGGSGDIAVWDTRTVGQTKSCAQVLQHPEAGVVTGCVTADPVQPHFVLGGTRSGQVCIWDRRGTEAYPINRLRMHEGVVWETRVVSSSKPGLLLSCGEDARVWLMDFASAAAARGGAWCDSGEFWRAEVKQSDLRNVAGWDVVLGVNGVDAHAHADLYAYTSDSGAVGFGSLYS